MSEARGEGLDVEPGRRNRLAAFGPAAGRRNVHGGEQRGVGIRQGRILAVAGFHGERRLLEASRDADGDDGGDA